jgi:hypothetical protein
MPDMGCALLGWCGGPYVGTFAFEAQIHREIKVVLPNRAFIFYSHELRNHFPSSGNEIDAGNE